MNAISGTTSRHLPFQETQLLPRLTAETLAPRSGATAPFGAQPHSKSSPEMTHRRLPFKKTQLLPFLTPEIIAGKDGTRCSPALESTTEGVDQMFAAMIGLSANWAMFNAWGVPPLG